MSSIHLKIFDNCLFLLQNVEYVHELKQNLTSISMFGGLGYYTSIEHDM